ncbi:MAG TPA: asparagine synthase (glutamine-hydrolyzing) [Blastocatellia bacterium]|nr:asparagine synthase (glutamine-hydrolyzing) [Blastocatellia bacterium]
MCGICGIYEYGLSEPAVTDALVVGMRDTMTHRGPDDAGVYVSRDRRVGLGNRRLSIVDLSPAGRNPMANEDGRVWITFNGEIYNHASLRPELEAKGHCYRSRTDTETIIHLYEERGLDFVEELEGDFAIGLWDEDARRLVLARDRIGVKPLYYTLTGGRLIFASEIKAILEHPAVSRDVDEQALYHYLTFLTTPAPQTLFAGIQKLPAGCMLTCDSTGEVKITRYWDAIVEQHRSAELQNEESIAQELLRLLKESIAKRMMSDVPFGVFLSGGVDSSANVALMSELMDQPVRTFTVGYRGNFAYNELEEARAIAKRFETDHHEIVIGQEELIDFLPGLVFHQDEPIADPVCVPLYYVSKLARETGTFVVQVGEGSDELFCGYREYAAYLDLHDYLWRHLARLPASIRRALAATGNAVYKTGGARLLPKGRKMVPDLLRRLAEGEELFWSGTFVFDEVNKQRLFAGQALEKLNGKKNSFSNLSSYSVVRSDLDRLLAAKPDADELERMIYQELKLRLSELLLMRVDKITMATSVEARVPFLDHKLVEFAMTIPRRLKYHHRQTKYILKRALREKIPGDVIDRRKKGFGVPLNEWMLGSMGRFVEDALLGSTLRRRGLFDYGFIKRMLDDQRAGRINYSYFLWCLLNLSLWYEHWIDHKATPAAFSNRYAATSQEYSLVNN